MVPLQLLLSASLIQSWIDKLGLIEVIDWKDHSVMPKAGPRLKMLNCEGIKHTLIAWRYLRQSQVQRQMLRIDISGIE